MAKTSKKLKKQPILEQPPNTRELSEAFRITLLGREWRVFFLTTEELSAAMGQEMSSGVQGLCWRTECCIFIKKGMSHEHTLATLAHETFHAVATPNQGTPESQQDAINEELAANLVGMLFQELLEQMPLMAKPLYAHCKPSQKFYVTIATKE
jgi:hypothetical protein